jgi:hypothetical protein
MRVNQPTIPRRRHEHLPKLLILLLTLTMTACGGAYSATNTGAGGGTGGGGTGGGGTGLTGVNVNPLAPPLSQFLQPFSYKPRGTTPIPKV